MRLSTRSRYGTRLILDLAQHSGEGPVQLGAIARRQGIPVKYLEQIIIPLKKAGYIKSVRGSKGGHMLMKLPEEITVGEIVTVLEGGLRLTECTDNPKICDRAEKCPTRILWKQATEVMFDKLNSITLSELMEMSNEDRMEEEIKDL